MVSIFVRKSLRCNIVPILNKSNEVCEIIGIDIFVNGLQYRVIGIYRPPNEQLLRDFLVYVESVISDVSNGIDLM